MIRWMGGGARLHASDRDVLLGFAASPFLLRVDPDGDVLDTAPGCKTSRRAFRGRNAQDGKQASTIHQDSELHGQQVSGRLYASSLKEDGTEQCPDTAIPTSDVGRPVTAFRGASLFVLDQRIHDGEPDRLRTVVRRFTVDPSACTGQVVKVRRRGS